MNEAITKIVAFKTVLNLEVMGFHSLRPECTCWCANETAHVSIFIGK